MNSGSLKTKSPFLYKEEIVGSMDEVGAPVHVEPIRRYGADKHNLNAEVNGYGSTQSDEKLVAEGPPA